MVGQQQEGELQELVVVQVQVQVQEPAVAGRRGVGRLVVLELARQEVEILEGEPQVEELREVPEAAILEPVPSHSPRKTTKWRLLGIQGISTISRPCSG